MDWMTGLRSTTPMPVDTSALSDDGLSIHARFGVEGLGWSVEVAEEVVETIFASMPALAAESTLRQVFTRGVRASLLREMRQAAGDDVDPLTAEGGDVARDFVRRGLDLTTLLESIRIGGAVSASAFITGANELVEDPERRADEIQRLSRLFFGTLEQFSRQMSEVYGLEQALARLAVGRTARRRQRGALRPRGDDACSGRCAAVRPRRDARRAHRMGRDAQLRRSGTAREGGDGRAARPRRHEHDRRAGRHRHGMGVGHRP